MQLPLVPKIIGTPRPTTLLTMPAPLVHPQFKTDKSSYSAAVTPVTAVGRPPAAASLPTTAKQFNTQPRMNAPVSFILHRRKQLSVNRALNANWAMRQHSLSRINDATAGRPTKSPDRLRQPPISATLHEVQRMHIQPHAVTGKWYRPATSRYDRHLGTPAHIEHWYLAEPEPIGRLPESAVSLSQ